MDNETLPRNEASGLALPPGLVLGKYRIVRKLGQGGFGITYFAQDTQTGDEVVIKENLPFYYSKRCEDTLEVSPLGGPDAKALYEKSILRFIQETRLLARLSHPNIVPVVAGFQALGTAYYVMPWVGACDLQNAAPEPNVINEAWLVPILYDLLGALDYLHGQNLLHRDLKPNNILLKDGRTPIIIDFGTARALKTEVSATKVSTPGYTPAEQVTKGGKRGAWTDLYTLGATCYRLITGSNPQEAVSRIVSGDKMPRLADDPELRKRFSVAVLEGVDKALMLETSDRWQSAKDWQRSLPDPRPYDLAREIRVLKEKLAAAEEDKKNLRFMLTELLERDGVPEEALEEALGTGPVPGPAELSEALQEAVAAGQTSRVRVLLHLGADLNAVTPEGANSLLLAVQGGHTACVAVLLSGPEDCEQVQEALRVAAQNGRADILRYLLAVPGVNVCACGADGQTPLHLAALAGQAEALRLLLSVPGVNVCCRNAAGEVPLQLAEVWGHSACVSLLKSAGG
ncbi:MAG: ankyrin repeat domain-containing protein [Akkermansia sp.]|nr:ankyrin repeat domain-containing protein [Akkermansia sp.]